MNTKHEPTKKEILEYALERFAEEKRYIQHQNCIFFNRSEYDTGQAYHFHRHEDTYVEISVCATTITINHAFFNELHKPRGFTKALLEIVSPDGAWTVSNDGMILAMHRVDSLRIIEATIDQLLEAIYKSGVEG